MGATEKEELQKQILALRTECQSKAQPLQQEVKKCEGEGRNTVLALIIVAIVDIAAEDACDLVIGHCDSCALFHPTTAHSGA